MTLDQFVVRISDQVCGIKYCVLDDLRHKLDDDVLQKNPFVDRIITNLENTPGMGDITDNLEMFKIRKKCFKSINWG